MGAPSKSPGGTRPAHTWMPGFQPPDSGGDPSSCCQPPSSWCFVAAFGGGDSETHSKQFLRGSPVGSSPFPTGATSSLTHLHSLCPSCLTPPRPCSTTCATSFPTGGSTQAKGTRSTPRMPPFIHPVSTFRRGSGCRRPDDGPS